MTSESNPRGPGFHTIQARDLRPADIIDGFGAVRCIHFPPEGGLTVEGGAFAVTALDPGLSGCDQPYLRVDYLESTEKGFASHDQVRIIRGGLGVLGEAVTARWDKDLRTPVVASFGGDFTELEGLGALPPAPGTF